MKDKIVAIVLAAGKGSRMKSETYKQFLEIEGKPLFIFCLEAFQKSEVDDIVLVTGEESIEYCKDLIGKYKIGKVSSIIKGGTERYNSVYNALCEIKEAKYVLIHDAARPMLDQEIIKRVVKGVKEYEAAVVAMPVKDTIKIEDGQGIIKETPDRNLMWQIQTPQAFEYSIIKKAYDYIIGESINKVTDDAMVLEAFDPEKKIKLIEGSYKNIKVTTPEDIEIMQVFLKKTDKK